MRISDWSSDVCSSDLTLSGRPEGMDKAAWRRQRELLAISRLQANVKAEIPVSNRIVPIRFRWGDPAIAARIANAYADAFVREDAERNLETNRYAQEYLQTQIDQLRIRVQEAEIAANDYARRNGIVNQRSEKRRVGKECVSKCRSRW